MNTFLLDKSDMSEDDVIKIASGCLRQKILGISRIGGGVRNKVYRLVCPSQDYVVKFYFKHPLDSRDRLGIEFKSISFLWEQGISQIPKPFGISREHGCAFYGYVKGVTPNGDVSARDIDHAVAFLEILQKLSLSSQSMHLDGASEAFYCLEDIIQNIRRRLELIEGKASSEEYDLLRRFLNEEFLPLFEAVSGWSKKYFKENALAADLLLPREFRTLSPSDFGFHNSLRINADQMVFLDFEYFGWDDPVKLVSDFLWHPAMKLSDDFKRYFVQRTGLIFAADPHFQARLRGVFPLFGLKWCLIFLNEFISSNHTSDKAAARQQQLLKARTLSTKITAMYQDFPYGN